MAERSGEGERREAKVDSSLKEHGMSESDSREGKECIVRKKRGDTRSGELLSHGERARSLARLPSVCVFLPFLGAAFSSHSFSLPPPSQ